MEFRILGPLEVVDDARPVPLDRPRLRGLLGYLLLHANEPVSADRVLDQLWGPEPAKTASASLQNYVSRLRKTLGADALVTTPAGYVLRVDPERLDVTRFERLTAEARGAGAKERAEKLRAALALWRGAPLEDLAFEDFVRVETAHLEEARVVALEERVDADLELGRAAELIPELEELVEAHPLRERLRSQLMLALYRAGRQADALDVYRETRRVLDEELGLEPSEELRQLERAILRQDPALGAAAAIDVTRPESRRTVTILFCDLVDSTQLARELDPEAFRALMQRYLDTVRRPVERHGGTVEKFIGDAVMAVFGVPELHEDDALRAVRAADEIRAALAELEQVAKAEWDVRLQARIALNSGEVVVLSAPGQDLNVTGAAVSVASHLEQRAAPGTVVLGQDTYGLVANAVRAEPVELADDFRAWRLDEIVAGAPAFARREDAPLVGRDKQLRRLRAAFDAAVEERHCRVATVVGEAGLGKTRLARELVGVIGDEARLLVGRCVSYGEGATYLPLAEIVRRAAPDASVEAIRSLLAGDDDADQVAQRIAEIVGIAEGPAAPGETFWAVRRLLEALAREQPVLLVLDDVHWAEPTLLDLVEYLGEWVEGPVLALCLARPELLEERASWGGPTSTGFVVELEPLEPDEVGQLVSGLAEEPVPTELRDRIAEHSGGNPLFAEQLVAVAREAPDVELDRAPPSVEALIGTRLDRLEPRELELIRNASVVGRVFTPADLADVADADDRALRELERRRLIRTLPDGAIRFHHVLVRDVAYRGIPKAKRAELHERAAAGLDRRGGADELVGYHFEQAYRYRVELARADSHVDELAVAAGERLGRAGIRAWKRADAPAAVSLLSRAVALMPEAAELACELGIAYGVRGDTSEMRATLNEALDRAIAAGDERVELRARIELALLAAHVEPGTTEGLLELGSSAIERLETYGDDRSLSRAWLFLGSVRGGFHCEFGAWEDAARRAAAHYRRAGFSPSTSLADLGIALFFGPCEVGRAIAECEELLADHEGDRASEANVLPWLGALEAMLGRFEEGRGHVATAQALHDELGHLTDANPARARAYIELLAGTPDDAVASLRSICEALVRHNRSAVIGTVGAELANVLVEAGEYEEAEAWVDTARRCTGSGDRDADFSWRYAGAKLLTRQGQIDEAERLALGALEIVDRTDAVNRHADCLVVAAAVSTANGRDREADARLRTAIDLYERKGNGVAAARARALLLNETRSPEGAPRRS